ncbi:MAG: DUF4209 domain-containing protein, partial [Spirochaetota bacterium]|nr:DUF4209 domain-containing protein [Spirochaetota bacterium]
NQDLQISSYFLNYEIMTLIDIHQPTTDEVIDHLFRAPAFTEDRREIIREGIKAYLNNNHIVAAHVLIPQIEHALRHLIELMDRPIYKKGRNGLQRLILLDEILRDDAIIQYFGDDIIYYFRVLFTESLGWNLRNDTCHGFIPSKMFTSEVTDRIFHSLLVIALVRPAKDDKVNE